MIRLLFILLLLAASTLLGLALKHDPGYVLVATRDWHMETTLWVAAVCLIASFFLFHLACLIIRQIIKTPKKLHAWYMRYKHRQGQAKTKRGLIEYSEGYWRNAKIHLIEALPSTEIPLFNYLTAARAAQELGELQLRDQFLRQAKQSEPHAKIAVELTQAQLQILSQQWEQALATLQHLHEVTPHHPYVLKLLAQLFETVKDWPALLRLLPTLKKYSSLSLIQFQTIEHRAFLEALIDLCKQNQIKPIQTFIKNLPKPLNTDPTFIAHYCRALIKNENWQAAHTLLKQTLNKKFSHELILLYADIPTGNDRITFAKSLLKENSHSASLHFCLGRLNLQEHLFGQARHHFEQSIAIQPKPESYFYLGTVLEKLNLPEEAHEIYKQGLQFCMS